MGNRRSPHQKPGDPLSKSLELWLMFLAMKTMVMMLVIAIRNSTMEATIVRLGST